MYDYIKPPTTNTNKDDEAPPPLHSLNRCVVVVSTLFLEATSVDRHVTFIEVTSCSCSSYVHGNESQLLLFIQLLITHLYCSDSDLILTSVTEQPSDLCY